MNALKFIVVSLATLGFIYLLNNPIGKTPALGKLLNPYTGFWQNAESVNQTFNSQNLPNLKGSVEVVYDNRMVPHIFADHDVDAAYVQGFITARHRLWQMEFQTHAAAGRIAEVAGERPIPLDKKMRGLGIPYAAKKTIKAWEKTPYYPMLEAYSNGVNAYINTLTAKTLPLEYKLMGYKPEEWKPYKTALLMKNMSYTLSIREKDMEMTNALNHFGKETFDELYPTWNPKQSPIIPKGTKWKQDAVKEKTTSYNSIDEVIPFSPFKKPYKGIGSNNWALSGKKTASGNPILCNDPHLSMTLPSIWYEIQITSPSFKVYGVSLPGAPGVIIGFNEHIAWGVTNVGHDVADWYTIQWKDASRTEYLLDGKYVKAELKVEEYKIKGQPSVYDTMRYTHWGPVVYNDPSKAKFDLALKWKGHDPSNEMSTFYGLNAAKNYDDYVKALVNYECPAQNFVFASKEEGDIGLWVQGKFALKENNIGRFVQDGTKKENDWKGFIPQSNNPHTKNPERGFVSSANQHSTDPSYPYYYHGNFANYRGRTINGMLEAMDGITAEDMQKMQYDSYSLEAEEAIPQLISKVDKSSLTKQELQYFKTLENWDFRYRKDAVGPTVFESFWWAFQAQVWDETKAVKGISQNPEEWKTLELLTKDPKNKFFDRVHTPKKETAVDISTSAFKTAVKQIQSWQKENNKEPIWMNFNPTVIRHLARIPAFSRLNMPTDGHRRAINAVYKQWGPSWRMIVQLDKEISATCIYPGGQSGNPGSPYYDNFLDDWASGKYYEALILKSADQKVGEQILGIEKYQP